MLSTFQQGNERKIERKQQRRRDVIFGQNGGRLKMKALKLFHGSKEYAAMAETQILLQWQQTNKKNEQNPRKNSNNMLNEPSLIMILFNEDLDPSIIDQPRTRSIKKGLTFKNKFEMSKKVLKRTKNERKLTK